MNIYSMAVLLFSFGVFLISLLAFFKRSDAIAFRFALFSISVCGWGFTYSVWTSQNYSPQLTLALIRISEVFAVFIPITWLHFVLKFVGKDQPFKHFYKINYSVAFVLAALCPTPLFFTGVHPIPIFHYYKTPGPAFYAFAAIFFALVPYAFYVLCSAYRSASGQVKTQLQCLIVGWLISFAAGSVTFLPVFNIVKPLPLLLLMPLYPVFIGVALIRYGLFDTEKLLNAFQREKLATLGIMAASLNHELRNPLFIAKGKIESHLDGVERGFYESDSRNQFVLSTALIQLTRAMEIIERFSSFSKPPLTDKKEKVVLSEVFESVVHLVANEVEIKKIQILQEPENVLSVTANRRQLEEIFFNLTINACHAMKEEGGKLGFMAYQPNGKVLVEISDTGSGISQGAERRIFEPFYSTKGEKGSGLGLYITKQLVERNGGKISVKSKPGQGTKFTLVFPIK